MARRRSRVQRDDWELVARLIDHISLLREYYHKAFIESDDRYLGEVAGKLRLLVLRGKRNKPLLLELMDHYSSNARVEIDSPFDEEPMTVDEYLDRLAFSVRLKDGAVKFTNREFVETWAQQHGSAHEDPSHDRRLAASRKLPVFIHGEHSHKWHLGAIARIVLIVSERFMGELETNGFVRRRKE